MQRFQSIFSDGLLFSKQAKHPPRPANRVRYLGAAYPACNGRGRLKKRILFFQTAFSAAAEGFGGTAKSPRLLGGFVFGGVRGSRI
ncbi:hypothetical protein HMPREF9123_1174 [Neisseria bacilliformis ATCC BAA-1200]|uniref:Uncharacterized protein n=1 Tax=Neisseria bacilliformis ATCC BAA-1200 TaxID=888742 RepID=F2BBR9_9NEIS|nr:hypothetical protein HMPREF9123_1174 [Neisseria bacilliformis ATCC BAA-1200]